MEQTLDLPYMGSKTTLRCKADSCDGTLYIMAQSEFKNALFFDYLCDLCGRGYCKIITQDELTGG